MYKFTPPTPTYSPSKILAQLTEYRDQQGLSTFTRTDLEAFAKLPGHPSTTTIYRYLGPLATINALLGLPYHRPRSNHSLQWTNAQILTELHAYLNDRPLVHTVTYSVLSDFALAAPGRPAPTTIVQRFGSIKLLNEALGLPYQSPPSWPLPTILHLYACCLVQLHLSRLTSKYIDVIHQVFAGPSKNTIRRHFNYLSDLNEAVQAYLADHPEIKDLSHISTAPPDISINISTNPPDISTNPQNISTNPPDTSTSPSNISTPQPDISTDISTNSPNISTRKEPENA